MDYRKKDIKHYFKDWVKVFGDHHLDIIKFLKENKESSITDTKDSAWIDTFDIVHQEAFPTNKKIIESPDAAKAFLGKETKTIREFVKEFQKERYGDLEDDTIWKISDINLLDDVELVNRYFSIIGEDIVAEWMDDPMNF